MVCTPDFVQKVPVLNQNGRTAQMARGSSDKKITEEAGVVDRMPKLEAAEFPLVQCLEERTPRLDDAARRGVRRETEDARHKSDKAREMFARRCG